jgi:protein-L-isoaspartate(D-aspartate) O-methyltransferase
MRRHYAVEVVFAGAISVFATLSPAQDHDYGRERAEMVREIARIALETGEETGRPRLDPHVTQALEKVPRHKFVPPDLERSAYHNRPLPIGYGQTISQPYIVAIMTELIDVRAGHVVLEVGTGSGYQAAVLAELAKSVFTIEIIDPLGKQAGERLHHLGYTNVSVKVADGYHGWPEHAPYDAIVVTAAASHVPPPLIKQLKVGGRMVIPVGTGFTVQHLMLVEKMPDGSVTTRQLLPVSFVPLTGEH